MGRRSNKDISSENQEEFVSQLTASTPEGRENEMIMLAYQEVERRIRSHEATGPELVHFLRMGSEKERLEREKLEVEMELQRAKADSIESGKRMEELYNNAIAAMKLYGGSEEDG